MSEISVARLWASGGSERARSDDGLLFFEGRTIFSFGQYFPIARHAEGAVLVTTESYPVPSNGHIALVRAAAADQAMFAVPDVEARSAEEHQANFRDYGRRIARHQALARASAGTQGPDAADPKARALVEEANAYARHFDLTVEPYAWTPATA